MHVEFPGYVCCFVAIVLNLIGWPAAAALDAQPSLSEDGSSFLQSPSPEASMERTRDPTQRRTSLSILAGSFQLTNPSGTWNAGCHMMQIPTRPRSRYFRSMDRYLTTNANHWLPSICTRYLEQRKAVKFYDPSSRRYFEKTDSTIPFCPTDDGEASTRFWNLRRSGLWGIKAIEKSLDEAVKRLPDIGFVILLSYEGFRNDDARDIMANNLCGLRRLGLLDRTIVFAVDGESRRGFEDDVGFLKRSYPEVNLIRDENFLDNVRRSRQTHGLDDIRLRWRYLPILLLLLRGYSVLSVDADIAWIRSPEELLHNITADVAYAYEGCMELNAGFGFHRPSSRTERMLTTLLGTNAPKSSFDVDGIPMDLEVAWAADQSLLNCAALRGVSAYGLDLHVLRTTDVVFHWSLIIKSLREKCRDANNKDVGDFMFAVHTSGSASKSTIKILKMLGLWEVSSQSRVDMKAQCVMEHDPLSQCRQGLRIEEEGLFPAKKPLLRWALGA